MKNAIIYYQVKEVKHLQDEFPSICQNCIFELGDQVHLVTACSIDSHKCAICGEFASVAIVKFDSKISKVFRPV